MGISGLIDYNKYTTLVQDPDTGETPAYVGIGEIQEISVPSA